MTIESWNTMNVLTLALASGLFGFLIGRFLPRPAGSAAPFRARGGGGGGGGGGKGPVELYVGNLPYETSEKDLTKVFERFGQVASVRIITKKGEDQSKGFGFVEMTNRPEAEAACRGLNGKDFNGRELAVNEARSRTRRHR